MEKSCFANTLNFCLPDHSPSTLILLLFHSPSSLLRLSFGLRSDLVRSCFGKIPEQGPNKVRTKEDGEWNEVGTRVEQDTNKEQKITGWWGHQPGQRSRNEKRPAQTGKPLLLFLLTFTKKVSLRFLLGFRLLYRCVLLLC
ncbi:Uncharacterised protein [Sphingobacterium daejeonense]|nr:Uncharacterised protein [Sphingobacterium daejeonense]